MEQEKFLISSESCTHLASISHPRDLPSMSSRKEDVRVTAPTGKWADLPAELLHKISKRLDLIERLSFRGVCKDWRAASNRSSSSSGTEPWFLLYEEKNPNCVLVKTDTGAKYRTHISELEGSTCIASHAGWVLARHTESNSFFFFYPFTRSRIDLPEIPSKNDSSFIGAFSSPPMDKDCVACVASNNQNSELELHVIRRGESSWNVFKPKPRHNGQKMDAKKVKSAVYYKDTLHFFEDNRSLVEFSVKSGKWAYYVIVSGSGGHGGTLRMPFCFSDTGFFDNRMAEKLGLTKNPVSVSTCGTMVNRMFVFDERAAEPEEESERKQQLKGAWIEPRFFEVTEKLAW